MQFALLFAVALTANTNIDAQRWLDIDFPAVRIGVAEYQEGPTGATVFYFPKGAKAAVDVRGGAPGTINTDALRLAYDAPFLDAVTFAGGSSYGLSVATGVAQAIKDTRTTPNELASIATVAGAIIFDVGSRRYSTVVPDEALGRAAFAAAKSARFPLGAHGAGRFAMNSGYFGEDARVYSGQGAAFRQIGATKIAVFIVINALGAIADRDGNIVRCAKPQPALSAVEGCGKIAARLASAAAGFSRRTADAGRLKPVPTPATTLTLVVTNQKLPYWALQRLAIQVHASIARAIQPFSTANDGDTLFALSTDEIDPGNFGVANLGVAASEVAWDAILSSVPELEPAPPASAPPPSPAGEYEFDFAAGARATVTKTATGLTISASRPSLYLPKEPVALVPLSATDFRIGNPRGAIVRFDAHGLVINPGPWPIPARRVGP